jgi:glycosyltransferase involved in cell wall biosynthesis
MNNKVSIIIPIRNEEAYIRQCLSAVFNQINVDGIDLEIIVADGLSTDNTRAIVKDFQHEHPNLILIDNPGKIVPTGINKAIKISQGDIIVRIDGHTTIAPDYIFQCVAALKSTDADNVGGRMDAEGATLFGQAVSIATSTPFGVGDSRFHYSTEEDWVDSVYMGAWRKEVFHKIGLFDEELVRNQDDEFNYRLRKHGGKILLSPKIKSKYTVRSTLKALWKQYYQYGFWKVRVLQKHPKQMSVRQFIPPLFVSSLIISLLASLLLPYVWLLFGLFFGYYLLVNLAVSGLTASRNGWHHLFRLPFVFPILHISYGLGFLVGLLKFANRWGEKVYLEPLTRPLKQQETPE